MGDVAMTVPVVSALAQRYPNLRITVLSRPFARTFFDGLAPNVGFMAAYLQDEERGMKGLKALYRRLAAKQFTAIADLHDTLRSKYLRMRFNLGRRNVEHINKHKAGKRRLTRLHGKQLVQQPTSFENYADVFARLGYPIDLNEFEFHLPKLHDTSILPASLQKKPEGERWLGMAPFAAHKGKVYPIEQMEKIIQILGERHPNLRIFLFGGGKTEQQQLSRWALRYDHCECMPGLVEGLHQEIVLMSQLDAMVSMDSANMHLASLVGTPVISIWGATHPYAGFMGWRQKSEDIVQLDLDCRPCSVYGKKACQRKDYACLNGITPEMIIQKIERYMI